MTFLVTCASLGSIVLHRSLIILFIVTLKAPFITICHSEAKINLVLLSAFRFSIRHSVS